MAHSPLKEGDRLLYNGSEPEWQGARGEIEEIDTVGGRPVVSARWSLVRDDDDSDDDQGGVLARAAAVRGSRAPRRTCRAAARPVSVDTTEDHYSVLSAADARIYRQAWLDANPGIPALRRLVTENLAGVERAIAAQERDARG